MRVLLTIAPTGLVSVGCAARLPVQDRADVARGAPAIQPAGTFVPEDRVTRILERVSATDSCFVRCALREGAERPEAEEAFLRHEVSVFLGYTFERGDGGPTIGADYMYSFNESVGVGVFVDHA